MIPSTEASLTNMANTHVGIRLAVSDQHDDVVWEVVSIRERQAVSNKKLAGSSIH